MSQPTEGHGKHERTPGNGLWAMTTTFFRRDEIQGTRIPPRRSNKVGTDASRQYGVRDALQHYSRPPREAGHHVAADVAVVSTAGTNCVGVGFQ